MKKRTLALVLACMGTLAHAGPFSNLMGSIAGGVGESDDGSRNLDQTLANVSAHLNRSAPLTLDAA